MNYFSLLGLPLSTSVHEEQLRSLYHARLKASQDDAGTAPTADLHAAYHTLRDPHKRLAHLLALSGATPSHTIPLPGALLDLFGSIAQALRESSIILQESRNASSPLARALLAPRENCAQQCLQGSLTQINSFHDGLAAQLTVVHPSDIASLQRLHAQFSFLSKWRHQVQERLLEFLSLT